MKKKINPSFVKLERCIPEKSQARIVHEWRNDKITRAMSYTGFEISWNAFWRAFRDEYFAFPVFSPVFITYKDERVGFSRFSLIKHPYTERECTAIMIAINISPEWRGKGIGSVALKLIKNHLVSCGADSIFADVRIENTPSKRAFLNAGFKICAEKKALVRETGQEVDIFRFLWEE